MQGAAINPRQRRALLWSIALAVALYLLAMLWSGWSEVVAAMRQVGAVGFTLVLVLSLVNYGLRFVRWQYYLSLLGQHISWGASALTYIAGFALTTTPGKAGELVRSIFLAREGMPYTRSIAAFFSERLSDLIAVMLLAALGMLSYAPGRPVFYVLVPLVLIALVVLSHQAMLTRMRVAIDLHQSRIAALAGHVLDVLLHSGRLYQMAPLFVGLGLGLVAWFAEGYAFYLMIGWMGQDMALETAIAIYAFSMLVGAVSFLPGGLGGAEIVMTSLLMLSGIPKAEAVVVTVLIRIATLWFAVVLGMGALLARSRAP